MEHPHPVRVVLRVGEQRAFESSRGRTLASVIARHRELLLCRWSFWQGQPSTRPEAVASRVARIRSRSAPMSRMPVTPLAT